MACLYIIRQLFEPKFLEVIVEWETLTKKGNFANLANQDKIVKTQYISKITSYHINSICNCV